MEGPASPGENPTIRFHPLLRASALVLSVIFHPLFIPLYATLLIMYSHPIQFADFDGKARLAILGPVIENTVILPLAVVLLLKPLGFIRSLRLDTQKDRIIPCVASMIFYYWLYRVARYHSAYHEAFPTLLSSFLLGIFIAVILTFLANIIMKISLHGVGMGSLVGILLLMIPDPYSNLSIPLVAALLATGLVCSSRLVLSAHRGREIYVGLAVGVISQFIALFFL